MPLWAVVAAKGVFAKDDLGKQLLERWDNPDPIDKGSLKKLKLDERSLQLLDNIRELGKS